MIELKANNTPTHDGWYIYRGTRATELVKVDYSGVNLEVTFTNGKRQPLDSQPAGLLWSDVISFEEFHH